MRVGASAHEGVRHLKSFRERARAKALERERVRACVRVCEKERVCV